jgi:Tol biopolymer transport system component
VRTFRAPEAPACLREGSAYSNNGSISLAPVWSPDGTELVMVRELKTGHSVWTVGLDGTKLAKLADIPADAFTGYGWGTAPPS